MERALRALQGATGARGDLGEANLRGLALLLDERPEEAKVVFEAILARDPDLTHARFNRGLTLLKLGDPVGASEDLEIVWKSDDQQLRPTAAFYLALAEQERLRLEEAEAWLAKAVALKPDFAPAHLARGTVLERMNQFEKAGRSYREALKLDPRSAIATLRFGVSAWRAGFRESALTHLRQVESMSPGSREAMEAQKYLLILE